MEQQHDDLLVFGIENPLIDISLTVLNDDLLNKYEIQMNSACLASEKQQTLYDEMWKMEGIETIPGGSCLNTIRSTNFMLKDTHPGKCGYFGCIGKDEYGKVLEEELKGTGVHGYFHKDETTPTGTCAVLIKNKDRALCANLGACVKYPKQHLLDNIEIAKKASFIYTTAFFITSNYDALIEVAKLAAESNKPLGYNLSAGFLIQFNTEQVNTVLQYADFVFCNEDEAAIFAQVNKLEKTDLPDVAIALAKWTKVNTKRPRTAIITQGKNPTLVATYQEGSEVHTQEFQVPTIPTEKIVDNNGAGDSFVGGFLSQIVQGKDLETAIKAGTYLAGHVIQRSGCTFPEKNEFGL